MNEVDGPERHSSTPTAIGACAPAAEQARTLTAAPNRHAARIMTISPGDLPPA
jgi:hypothetical protein